MKIVKWLLSAFLIILCAFFILALTAWFVTEHQRNQLYDINVVPLNTDPDHPEILQRGEHIATIRQCIDCHGPGLGGRITLSNPITGRVVSSNLTSGQGGLGSYYSDADFVRAIRNGINHKGKPSVFMPSDEYTGIDKDDLTALISYIRSVDPVDNELPDSRIRLIARIGHLLLPSVELFPARFIDHSKPIPEQVSDRTPIQLGQYLASSCSGCHGTNFSGGRIQGVPSNWPIASNLTPNGAIGDWTIDEFTHSMRTGITPDGHQMNPEYMPWHVFRHMTDDELTGLYLYLKSLPQKNTGSP